MVQNPIQTRHGRKGILPSLNWKSASSYSRTGPVTPVMISGVPEIVIGRITNQIRIMNHFLALFWLDITSDMIFVTKKTNHAS